MMEEDILYPHTIAHKLLAHTFILRFYTYVSILYGGMMKYMTALLLLEFLQSYIQSWL